MSTITCTARASGPVFDVTGRKYEWLSPVAIRDAVVFTVGDVGYAEVDLPEYGDGVSALFYAGEFARHFRKQ